MKVNSHGVRVDVSIVITAYNSKNLLEKCITSIIDSVKNHTYEIIVVDDASTDGTSEMITNIFKDSSIKIIKNQMNVGYVRSNNLGIKSSNAEYVLSLNNDTEVLANAIDKLIDFIDIHPQVGAVGPKLLNSDGSIQLQCRRKFPTPLSAFTYFSGISRLFPMNKFFNSYLMSYPDDQGPIEVDSLCGAAMLVRRETIEKVGLMDESYFMYGDDIDWCYRIKKAGWKIYYFPDAEIVHYGGMGGSRKKPFRNIFEFHRSMAVYYKKHYSVSYIFLANWVVYCGIWLKYSIAILQNLLRKDKFVGTKKP